MARSKASHKFSPLLIAVCVGLFALGCGIGYYFGSGSGHEKSQPLQAVNATEKFSASSLDTASWNTYTNPRGNFSIQYPPTWKLEESHRVSNREADDVTELNTATLRGKEGEIILQWGQMGFGGACDEKDVHPLKLKELEVSYCNGLADGKNHWGQIYNPNDKYPFGARSVFHNTGDEKVIKAIFSTLTFLK